MSKSLFRPENGTSLTDDAHVIDKEVHAALKPIMDKWCAAGYSPREIDWLMVSTVMELGAWASLDRDIAIAWRKR